MSGLIKKIILVFIFALLIFPAKKNDPIEQLPLKYKQWLELVWWVITPKEKEVFLKLTNNRDRDVFIKTFWKVRDPNPATPQNEYKEELIRRFNYANKYLGTDSPKPGWKTDRGRIYILLGKPASIERYYMDPYIVPTEVWYYYGNTSLGLPSHFALIFFRRNGTGEFKLYDPLSDGPYALLLKNQDTRNLDPTNFEQLYQYIRQAHPTLADVSLSLIPGQIPYGYQPSFTAASIMSNVLTLPEREFDTSYAEDFLKYKGIVDVDYSMNYINARFYIHVAKDPRFGINFIHYAIEPSSVSFDRIGKRNIANFEVDASIKDHNGNIVFQYRNNFTIELNDRQLTMVRNGGVSLQGEIPIVEGDYEVILLVKNTISKEFSYIDTKVKVPPPENFYIEAPLVSYGKENLAMFALKPFTFGNTFFYTDAKKAFSAKDRPVFLIRVSSLPQRLWETGILELVAVSEEKKIILKKLNLNTKPYRKDMDFTIEPDVKLPAGEYEIYAKIGEIKSPIEEIAISPISGIPRPIISSSILPLNNQFLIYLSVGSQYFNLKKYRKALVYLEKSFKLKPDFKETAMKLAQTYLLLDYPQKALAALSNLNEEGEYEVLFYKGKAYEKMGLLDRAVLYYKRSIATYDSDPRVLNSLGLCYLKLNKKEEALKVLEASLKLNPKQPSIIKILEKIK